MQIIKTVGVLIFENDKILMVEHGEKAGHPTGTFGIPAGRIDPGENIYHAVIRELYEETGLNASSADLEQLDLQIPPVDLPRKTGVNKRFSITVFYCKKYSGKLQNSDESNPKWISISDLDKLNLIGNTKTIILEGLKEINSSLNL